METFVLKDFRHALPQPFFGMKPTRNILSPHRLISQNGPESLRAALKLLRLDVAASPRKARVRKQEERERMSFDLEPCS